MKTMIGSIAALGFFVLTAVSQDNLESSEVHQAKHVAAQQATSVDRATYLNTNYLFSFFNNDGVFGRDADLMFGQDYGTFYPYLSIQALETGGPNLSPLWTCGLDIAGIDSATGDTLVAIANYTSEYVPGPMLGGTYQTDRPEFHVYKLHYDSLEANPNQDYLDWPADQGAPVDGDGKPAMRGDQMLWTVFNDADPGQHTNGRGSTDPLGVEVQMTAWAYGRQHPVEFPPVTLQHVGSGATQVTVTPTRPSLLTGHEYAVTFSEDYPNGGPWYLKDLTLDEIVTNPADHGLLVQVEEANELGVESWEVPAGTLKFSAENANGFGWEEFDGALGWGGPGDIHGYGSYEPVPHGDLVNVLLKLAPTDAEGNFDPMHEDVSYAYRYLRNASSSPAQPEFEPYILPGTFSYDFQAFEKNCPLSAWNVEVYPPQRLTLGFLENNTELGLVNGRYWPPSSDSLATAQVSNTSSAGPREWLWIFLDNYSETPNPDYELNAIDDPMPIMYWATWARPSKTTAFEDDDEFLIVPSEGYTTTSADTFYFEAPAPLPAPQTEDVASIYIRYKLINKGDKVLKDFFVSLWSDPDLGWGSDDLAGCDTIENRWFCFNGSEEDNNYGQQPPAVGFKLLEGPVVPSEGDTALVDDSQLLDYKNLPLYAFMRYFGDEDPSNSAQVYVAMQGLNTSKEPYTYDGHELRFMKSGDPVTSTGDVDFFADERLMNASTGPLDFRPNDTQQIMIKMAVGEGSDRLDAITKLRAALEYTQTPTAVEDPCGNTLPQTFTLAQNYPNPFNPSTVIEYALPERCEVTVDVYNILGQKVLRLFQGEQTAGRQKVEWDGVDASGHTVATGVYFYRVTAGEAVATKKMMLVK